MRPLVTLTGNLLAERTLELADRWEEGRTHRAVRESFQVGGKGFNVAKMLHRLGQPVTAAGLVGGAAGEECRAWLAQHAPYPVRLFDSDAPTRSGFVVRARGRAETTFFAPDRMAGPRALSACAEFLNTLPAGTGVALCGSFPGWAEPPAAELRAALADVARRGMLVVDTYGPPLAELVGRPLQLVKINRAEFDALWPAADRAIALPDRLGQARQRWPVVHWVITDGPRPVWLASPHALESFAPPPIEEVSATGSGDVLLAGLLHTWFSHAGSLAEALRFALPLAAANAASSGVADFPFAALPGDLQARFEHPGPVSVLRK